MALNIYRRQGILSVLYWPDAKTVAAERVTAGSWSGPVKPAEPLVITAAPADPSQSRLTIADAIRSYLAIREGAGIASATLRKHRTFTKQLAKFAEARGYMMLDQFTSRDIHVFYGS
jgi:hypothetical protein